MDSHLKLILSLKRLFWLITGPAVLLFASLLAAQKLGEQAWESGIRQLPGIYHGLLFTCAAVTAIAAPVMIRVIFAHKVRQNTRVQISSFLTFQRSLIISAGITPYLALAAVCGRLSQFHTGGIILMALYAVYYYFPSQKRIVHDIKLFRVKLPPTMRLP